MLRPKIVVIMMASVDGRIATAPRCNVTEWAALGIDRDAHEIAHRQCGDLDCDGMNLRQRVRAGLRKSPCAARRAFVLATEIESVYCIRWARGTC